MITLFIKVTALLVLAWLLALLVTNAAPAANAAVPSYQTVTVQGFVRQAAYGHGYSSKQVRCLNRLIERESKWNALAKNPHSSASGLFQHLRSPSGVMMRSLPVVDQTRRGLTYIDHRYAGDACLALRKQIARGWY